MNRKSFRIIKEITDNHGMVRQVYLLNSQCEVLEINERKKADRLAFKLNINDSNGFNYLVS